MSYVFDGLDDRLHDGTDGGADLTIDNYSIMFWYAWAAAGGNDQPRVLGRNIDSGSASSHMGCLLSSLTSAGPNEVFRQASGAGRDNTAQSVQNFFRNDTWENYIVRYNRTLTPRSPVYRNGVQIEAAHNISAGDIVTHAGTTFAIGGLQPGDDTRSFAGKLAHVAIWNRDLTAQEIADLSAGGNPLAVAATGLIRYWPLTANSSTHADQAGSGHDLTVYGATYSSDDPAVAVATVNPYVNKIKQIGAGTEVQIYADNIAAPTWTNEAKAAHDLTIVGGVVNESGGPALNLTKYVQFDGIDDHASCAHHADLVFSGVGSFGIWVWIPSGWGGSQNAAAMFGKGGADYEFRQLYSQPLPVAWHPQATSGISPVDAPPYGEWLFFVVVDNNTAATMWQVRSGDTDAVQVASGTVPAAVSTTNDFALGARGSDKTRNFNGRIAGFFSLPGTLLTGPQVFEIYESAFAEPGEFTYLPPALTVTLQDPTTKSLSWTDQNGTKYIIERNSSPDGIAWSFDKFVEEAGLTLLDTIVDDGTEYRYRIKSAKAV